jgi:hypothetical protein
MRKQKQIRSLGLLGLLVWLIPVTSSAGAAPQQTGVGEKTPASSPEKLSLAKMAAPEDMLRGFKSYYIKSDTIYLHPETLQKELQGRKEFPAWGLTPIEDSKAADVLITITLPFLTWEWNYRMEYQPTGTVLGTGKVSAAVEKTATPQLAAMIVKRISEARPLPASFQETAETRQVLPNSSPEKGKSWKVRYISGPVGPTQDTPVTLTVNREWMTVHNSKTLMFSASVLNLSALDSRTEMHKATEGWEGAWDKLPDATLPLLIFALPVFWAGEGILTPIKTTDHFVTMYWLEDGATKRAEFRASASDTQSLLAELNKVTGRKAEDLQELTERRQKSLREQFDGAPIVGIDRPVSIGWHSLAPGSYRLFVVTRERNLAEVYFVPADKTAKDLWNGSPSETSQVSANTEDFATQAVAELERRKPPLENKAAHAVSYREQNGIVTFSQIETNEMILRFTPIPLGLAK